jgi:hypothetical protein
MTERAPQDVDEFARDNYSNYHFYVRWAAKKAVKEQALRARVAAGFKHDWLGMRAWRMTEEADKSGSTEYAAHAEALRQTAACHYQEHAEQYQTIAAAEARAEHLELNFELPPAAQAAFIAKLH